MKQAKRAQRRGNPTERLQLIDECHTLFGSSHQNGFVGEGVRGFRKPAAGFLITQFVMRFNSGKRVRYWSVMTRADGSPIKAPPRKFYPAQVVRRSSI